MNNVREELEKIEIPKELHERSKLGIRSAKAEKRKRKLSKKIIISAAASVFFISSIGAGAASIPSFNHLLSIVSPQLALLLQPIEMSSEDKGIKMEVVAAMNDEEMAVIYVAMQDLKGNRIDETLDLYDYSLTGARAFNSQIVDYDEASNSAILRIQANGGEELSGKKVNFRIDSFLSNKQIFENVKVDTDLNEVTKNKPQITLLNTDNISSGGQIFEEIEKQETIQILKTDQKEIYLPEIEFMHISNIGFIDDRLHIQTKWERDSIDDHGFFYLTDDLGEKIIASSISFDGNKYIEYIFDKGPADIEKLKLMGEFVANGNHITGEWNTTFQMQAVQEEKNINFRQNFGTWTAEKMTVSPLGVTLYGEGEFNSAAEILVSAKMKDGSIQIFDSTISLNENREVQVKFLPGLPVEVSNIDSININGVEMNQ
ncbi:DUF4179 domain-containing protein [Metabacillus fastidiosus]|uniref:DUF4179 domain-containing protein n=1 Tax=Metabacillus fastidiosus TaxID=1458 RepID=UPI002E205FE5|nr:DUF4179 domain-containing protein [Metabacillus fastidiosus]